MNTAWRPSLLTGSLCALAALLAGCSAGSGKGLGNAGNQSSYKPEAVITPIGQVSGPDGTLYVRSGAEVLLSSKDSDGRDSAVLGVTWSATNTAAQAVKMLERGANAMSFRAPTPSDDTPLELRFGLSIRTADGDTNATEIRVLVSRAPDPNDFLLSDVSTTVDAVNLVVVASAATSSPTFATDIPFTIGVQKQVRYKRAIDAGANPSASPAANDPLYCTSPDPTLTCVKIGPPLQLTGAWKAGSGVAGTLRLLGTPLTVMGAAYQNPRFRLRPPSLNVDEVNFAILTNGVATNVNGTGVPPEDARRNNLLYTADIDSAEAEYVFTMTSSDLGATNRRVDLLVFAADSTAPGSLTFLAEGQAATAADPGVATVTGTLALDSIRTAPGVVESRSSAQAYYTAIDPAGKRTTLDDWLNDNCMQRALAGAPGYYGSDIHATYLNDRDLGFGREMYFKTDCTTAQRGATSASINTVGGERASIVFNYSSLEAAIKRSGAFLAVAMEYRADASGGVKYTRFYTFAPDPRTRVWKRVASANFDGRRERYTPGNCTVCHGGKPKATYAATAGAGDLGSTFIPWDANALLFSDTDHSILDDRLKPGFTRAEQLPNIHLLNGGVAAITESRIGETQPSIEILARWNAVREVLGGWTPILPPAGTPNLETFGFVPTGWRGATSANSPGLSSETIYSQVIAGNCRMCHLQRITDAGAGGLIPASAPQFSSFADTYISGSNLEKLKERVFEQHIMPSSRLTSDRFWVPQPGSTQSAAQVLAAHLGLTLPAGIPGIKADGALAKPEQASIDPNSPTADLAVRLTGMNSRFASTYSWTLTKPAGSQAALVGANTAEPALQADSSGVYAINLTVTDDAGHSKALTQPVSFTVNRKPVGGSYAVSYNGIQTQASAIDLVATGGAKLGDGTNSIVILAPLPAGISASINGAILSLIAGNSGRVRYRITDADGEQADGEVNVTVILQGQWGAGPFNRSVACPTSGGYDNCASDLGINPTTLAQTALGNNLASLGYTVGIAQDANQLPSATGRRGTKGSSSIGTTFVSYISPQLFVSAQTATTVIDTFKFRVQVRNAAGVLVSESADITVNVTVNPRYTWSGSILPMLRASCTGSSCHSPAADGAIRGWGSLGDPPNALTDGTVAYSNLTGSGCPLSEAPGTAHCVERDAPADSVLLHKPNGELSHTGGQVLNSAQLLIIENWIRDGYWRN